MKFNPLWRFLAILALLLYALIVILIVRLFTRNIGFVIFFGLTIICLAYAIWLLFGASVIRVHKLRWFIGGIMFLFIVEVLYLVWNVDSIRAIVELLLLTAAYLVLISLLRKKYWSTKRLHEPQTTEKVQFKKPYLIMNPKSGNGRAMKAHIDELATKQRIRVLVLKKGNDVESVARKAVRAGADVLGISGGDGSIGAVVKVAIEFKLPIVILPGGTRCHFARDLGLAPERIADALTGFRGIERQVDVGVINGRYFLNNASFGLYADIIDNPDYRDHKAAVSRKVISSITSGQKPPYALQFNHGKNRFNKAVQVLVGVNCYDTFNILELGHRNRMDEGVLQVTAITKTNDKTVKQLMMNMRTAKMPGIYQWKTTKFRITNKKKIVVGVDGEREEYASPVLISILPKALRIFVPPEGERNRPKSQFGETVINQVWRMAVRQNNY